MNTTLKNGSTLALTIATTSVRKPCGTIQSMSDWISANHPEFGTLDAAGKKPIRDAYNELKASAVRENKAVAAALVSHEGLRVNRVAVRTLKSGAKTFTITGSEKPVEKAPKAGSKLAEALAEIERLKAQLGQTVDVPQSEGEILDVESTEAQDAPQESVEA